MNTRASAGGAFAHLLGRGKTQAAKAESDEKDDKDKDAKAETGDTKDPDDNEDEKKDKLDDVKDDKSDDDDGTSKDAKGKKAKAEGGDDDDGTGDPDEDEVKAQVRTAYNAGLKAGRKAEKARATAIFGCDAAADRPDIAAQLAFGTDLNAEAAIETLKAVGNVRDGRSARARGPGIDERMAQVPHPDVGSELKAPEMSADEQFVSRFEAAQKVRRGE